MSGTDHTKEMLTGGPTIILVEPQLGENIGMVARAMANFGLSELRLVNPRDGWPSERARAAASRADHVIDRVQVFETLEEAIADVKHVMATTARRRDMIKPVLPPDEATRLLHTRMNAGRECAILFGRERWGLENHEVALADELVTFPVNPAFASLNIAQAVLLMSYEWMRQSETAATLGFDAQEPVPANKGSLTKLLDHLEAALDEAKYFYPPEKEDKMRQNLRSLFVNSQLQEPEIHSLHGMIAALERRWQRRRDERESKAE